MALVAGVAFFVLRALSPALARGRPIKKWAAAGAPAARLRSRATARAGL
jgi:hypothetical protein